MHLKPTLLNSATVNMRLGKIWKNSLCYHKSAKATNLAREMQVKAEYY